MRIGRGWTLGIALVACLSSRASAGGAADLGDALRDGKFKMLRMAAGQGTGPAAGASTPVVLAHADLLTEGKPLARGQVEAATLTLRSALERLWPERLAYIEVGIYAPGRLLERGAPVIRTLDIRTKSNSPSGALWVPVAESVDTKKPVHWYAKVVWFRPYTIRASEVSNVDGWEAFVWYAEANAAPRPEQGGVDQAPERVR